jgi:3-phenylpropionate/trans-cinnamate dioxygenase ferredoxin subunit
MNWTPIGRVEEFGPGFHLQTCGEQRVVIAVIDGEVFAFDPLCPHAGGPLELAETDGCVIACPLHGWRFDLRRDGCEVHGYRPVRMFPLRIEHGRIYVAVDGRGRASEPVAYGNAGAGDH